MRNVVIGGGFFGAMLAAYLSARGERVVIIEREDRLMSRASYHNQARIHGGYHYPRNRTTGRRSAVNMSRFMRDFSGACLVPKHSLYAVAAHDSLVTPTQFEEFSADIGAPLSKTPAELSGLFDADAVAAHWKVSEFNFDAVMLMRLVKERLDARGVVRSFDTTVTEVDVRSRGGLTVHTLRRDGSRGKVQADRVFNCTYAGLHQIEGVGKNLATRLKLELTEMPLIKPIPSLKGLGITVMDGPFWSMQPFPARGDAYTLSHVSYTPHCYWLDEPGRNPYEILESYPKRSAFQKMMADASRYVPALAEAKQIDSLWEVKAVLVKSEGDDGRPITFERHGEHPMWSILGGKIDNIYDLIEALEELPAEAVS